MKYNNHDKNYETRRPGFEDKVLKIVARQGFISKSQVEMLKVQFSTEEVTNEQSKENTTEN